MPDPNTGDPRGAGNVSRRQLLKRAALASSGVVLAASYEEKALLAQDQSWDIPVSTTCVQFDGWW